MDDLGQLVALTVGATLLAGVLGIAGLQLYASGKAQRRALVERLADAPALPPAGRARRFARLDRR
ncbi:hypothetical protein B7P34_35820, partial [Streptosporangium nondiastaticum]